MTKKHYYLSFLGITCLILTACATIKMNVKTYSDPEKNLLHAKHFTLLPINKENPLLEKELLFMVKERLIQKGYIYDDENPDFLGTISFYCGPFQYYVPPTTIYLPHYVPGETKTYTGFIGSTYVYGTEKSSGKYESKPHTTGGYTATSYYRDIKIYFV